MSREREILVCAATGLEEKACKLGIKTSGIDDAFQILRTGMGRHAGDTFAAYLAQNKKPTLVVSTGVAGAITSSNPILHSWIVAERIFSEQEEVKGVALQQDVFDTTKCALISLPRIFKQDEPVPNIISSLGTPLAVDMESAELARVSSQNKIPFMVLRMVTDTPQEPLPEIFYTLYVLMSKGKLQSFRRSLGVAKEIPGLIKVMQKLVIWSGLLREGWTKYAPAIAQTNVDSKET